MKKDVHVVPFGARWATKIAGKADPVSTHKSQELARIAAVPIAKEKQSDVVIHRKNGTIRDKDSYGNDPNPPKDQKH